MKEFLNFCVCANGRGYNKWFLSLFIWCCVLWCFAYVKVKQTFENSPVFYPLCLCILRLLGTSLLGRYKNTSKHHLHHQIVNCRTQKQTRVYIDAVSYNVCVDTVCFD